VSIILACQEAEQKYGFEYETKYAKQLEKFSREIIEKDLVSKCEDTYFAEQLCMKRGMYIQELNRVNNADLLVTVPLTFGESICGIARLVAKETNKEIIWRD
jgi:hypothetical protein